jgi:ubiquinone/menaquinone biosynthesis C-methylase UbiE
MKGTSDQIPAEDKKFQGAIATLTIHHWTDLKESFKEIHRVLTDDGRIVFFTSTPDQIKGYWLNHYFPEMIYASAAQMPSVEIINQSAMESGFRITQMEKYFVQDDLTDQFLYAGKNNPYLYFDENIRKGISSFSSLANSVEVGQGLIQLESDIRNKKFDPVKIKYENDSGDYLFIVAEKI